MVKSVQYMIRETFIIRKISRSHAEGATGVHRRPHLLRAGHACKGACRERKGESHNIHREWCHAEGVLPPPRPDLHDGPGSVMALPNQPRMTSDNTIKERTRKCLGSNSQGVSEHSYQPSGRQPWDFSRFESDTTPSPLRGRRGVREDLPTLKKKRSWTIVLVLTLLEYCCFFLLILDAAEE